MNVLRTLTTSLAVGLTGVAAAAPVEPAPAPTPVADPVPDTVEVVFTAKARPVRVQVRMTFDGMALAERWTEVLREQFAAFDRDGNGSLNAEETARIFPVASVRKILQGGFGLNEGQAVTPKDLDANGDGKVTFPEFAAYYKDATAELVKPFQAQLYNPDTSAVTRDLFARLDKDKDGKLSEAEVRAAEKVLLAIDSDEDECVSYQELAANPFLPGVLANPNGDGMMGGMMGRPNRAVTPVSPDVTVYTAALPGTLVQQVIKLYDRNGDFELGRDEIGFDEATLARLDRNKDGKLSPLELDRWRTGQPDAVVIANAARKLADSSARIVAADGETPVEGLSVSSPQPNRVVIRFGAQTLDIGLSTSNPYGDRYSVALMYPQFFPAGKDEVTEKDVVPPQFQILRVIFDAADFDGDGKLTKAEARRYGELVQGLGSVGLSAGYVSRTPNFFQLMDESSDGRISLRELRTAWPRLIALEGEGKTAVTQAVLQPSAVVRVGSRQLVQADPMLQGFNPFGPRSNPTGAPAQRGPRWFWKLDRNGDGDVSQAEFVGSAADFAAIDTDKDGLITLPEAEAYERKVRPAKEQPAKVADGTPAK